jgi:hypothetical protein
MLTIESVSKEVSSAWKCSKLPAVKIYVALSNRKPAHPTDTQSRTGRPSQKMSSKAVRSAKTRDKKKPAT